MGGCKFTVNLYFYGDFIDKYATGDKNEQIEFYNVLCCGS